jgi:hypothetical protein
MTEGATLTELERLLDALPDEAARQRVLNWATAKYAKVKFVPALQPSPTVNLPPFTWVGDAKPYVGIATLPIAQTVNVDDAHWFDPSPHEPFDKSQS